MKKTVLLLATVTAALLMAGCSEAKVRGNGAEGQSSKQQASPKKQKTAEANEGMTKKEEKDLQKRLADLEDKIDDKTKQKTEEQASESASAPSNSTEEGQVRMAAGSYYAMVQEGDWDYTYNHLDETTRSTYTYEQWVAANDALASPDITYTVGDIAEDSPGVFGVDVTLSTGDVRHTYFVNENNQWLHSFSDDEYALFASVVGSSASASAASGASSSASASATDDTKHIKIVITSNKPADVSINDDSMNWFITEEISGTETYEKDIAADSGLSVSATTNAYHAQTTIEVYENGELVAQDSDPNGFAMVNY
jgi:Skp family chaperone for outer membrane proteins